MKNTCYLNDEIFLKHDTGAGHPENPERLSYIDKKLKDAQFFDDLELISPAEADLKHIELVHPVSYIEIVKNECEAGYSQLSTGDTVICRDSYNIARNAVGGVLNAVDMVMTGKVKNAFCAVRPPGHHASQERGMGFCVFNNIAVAARYAQNNYGIERVMIVDWDVHHGNGTQDIFYSDGSVFFMSTHQSPLYPGTGKIDETGEGDGKGLTMNRPFPPGAGNDEIIGAFKNDLLPAAEKFKPDLLLISAGFDSRIHDPLGSFNITDDGFRELTKILLEIAETNCGGKVVSVLEGGYNLDGLASAVHAHIHELTKAN
ncbi:histone deacetylase [candidate division KSB1 bacterium]